MPSVVGVYGLESQPERFGELALSDGSVGAGFFVDGRGTVVTAAHVTSDYETILVRLADQRLHRAEKVAEDKDLDIAVIRVPMEDSVPVRVGRGASLQPGDWVLAVGEPFGLRRSVLAGVVGGSLRHFGEDTEGMFIQTNISLNPGNSGGPLLDLSGAVVGMNVRTVVGAQGTGVSLSIPIDLVLQVARELQGSPENARPRLGARFEDVSPPVAFLAGLPTTRGAIISDVGQGSLAERAGFRVGDIVLRMDQTEVADSADLSRRLFAWRRASRAGFVVVRDGAQQSIVMD